MPARPWPAVLVAAALVTAGCGDGEVPAEVPVPVAVELAPASVAGGTLEFHENRDAPTLAAFADKRGESVVSDGRLWEVRRADRLVATLQITTVAASVDLTRQEARDQVVSGVLPGEVNRIRVGDVEVYSATANNKTAFVWFGRRVFEVLQVGASDVEPEQLVTEIVEHQRTLTAWEPLPLVAEKLD